MSGQQQDQPDDAEDESQPTSVIDLGSSQVRGGFSGDDLPRIEFDNVVYRPRQHHVLSAVSQRSCYVGECPRRSYNIMKRQPVQDGRITDFDDIESVLHHTFFYELRIDPAEQKNGVAITGESPQTPPANRERMAQILFETFGVQSLLMAPAAAFSVIAAGTESGLVVNCSHTRTTAMAVVDFRAIPHTMRWTDVAGACLLREIQSRLNAESNVSFTTSAELEIVWDIIRTKSYVASSEKEYGEALEANEMVIEYELPDGSRIEIGRPRLVPECLFRTASPEFVSHQPSWTPPPAGISDLAMQAILANSPDIRHTLLKYIVPTGGVFNVAGMKKRFDIELKLEDSTARVLTVGNSGEKPQYMPWIGASIVTSLSSFKERFTKAAYAENGAGYVNVVCPV